MASTIYTIQNPSPRNEVRDMDNNQIFSGTIDGVKCTDYRDIIYRVSDNVQVYDSTKLTLGTPLADGEILEATVVGGTIPNTGTDSYKWTREVWNGAESKTSREFQFFAKTTPVLTFSPPATITTQEYEFTATLVQAEGDIPNNYTFELYDSLSVLLEPSGLITNFNIAHIFDGFTNGDNLKVRVNGTTTGNDTFDSGLVAFTVVYAEPNITIVPTATVDNETSLVTVERSEVVQIIGTGFGDVTYDSGIFTTGDQVLKLGDASSYVSFDIDIPIDGSLNFKWRPFTDAFEGKIMQLDNGAYEIGYETGRFYWEINGTKIYGNPLSLTGRKFYIVPLPTTVKINYEAI